MPKSYYIQEGGKDYAYGGHSREVAERRSRAAQKNQPGKVFTVVEFDYESKYNPNHTLLKKRGTVNDSTS